MTQQYTVTLKNDDNAWDDGYAGKVLSLTMTPIQAAGFAAQLASRLTVENDSWVRISPDAEYEPMPGSTVALDTSPEAVFSFDALESSTMPKDRAGIPAFVAKQAAKYVVVTLARGDVSTVAFNDIAALDGVLLAEQLLQHSAFPRQADDEHNGVLVFQDGTQIQPSSMAGSLRLPQARDLLSNTVEITAGTGSTLYKIKAEADGETIYVPAKVNLMLNPVAAAGLALALRDHYGDSSSYQIRPIPSTAEYAEMPTRFENVDVFTSTPGQIRAVYKLPQRRYLVLGNFEETLVLNFDDLEVLTGVIDAQYLIDKLEPGVYKYGRLNNITVYDGDTKLVLTQ